jgi:hypothetical protein
VNPVDTGGKTPVTRTCEEDPCVVCMLRAYVQRAGPPSHAVPEAKFRVGPLDINLVGLRRLDSITSDRFDDRMVVFFALPPGLKRDPSAFEDRFVKELQDAVAASAAMVKSPPADAGAAKLPPRLREVRCSTREHGVVRWIMGVFPISTDAGLVARAAFRDGARTARAQAAATEARRKQLAALDQAVADLTAKWKEKAKALAEQSRRKPGDPPPGPAEKAARAQVEKELLDLQKQLAASRNGLQQQLAGEAKDVGATRRAVTQRLEALNQAVKKLEADAQALEARDRAAPAGKPIARASLPGKPPMAVDVDGDLASLERAAGKVPEASAAHGKALLQRQASQEAQAAAKEDELRRFEAGQVPAPYHCKPGFDDYAGAAPVAPGLAGEGGFAGDGRAVMPVRFHEGRYKLGFHHPEHPALRTGYLDGLRACTGRFLEEHYLKLIDWEERRLSRVTRHNGKACPQDTILEPWGTEESPRLWLRVGDQLTPLDPDKDVIEGKDPTTGRKFVGPARQAWAWATTGRFLSPFPVHQIRSSAGVERLEGARARIELDRTDGSPAVKAYLVRGEERTRVDGEAEYVIEARIGGTNIHRGHGVVPSATAPDGWEGQYQTDLVSNWSTGCQVFRFFADFDVFFRLVGLSRRSRCVRPPGPPPSAERSAADKEVESARAVQQGAADAAKQAGAARERAEAAAGQLEKTGADPRSTPRARAGAQAAAAQALWDVHAAAVRAENAAAVKVGVLPPAKARSAEDVRKLAKQRAEDAAAAAQAAKASQDKAEEKARQLRDQDQKRDEHLQGGCRLLVTGADPKAPLTEEERMVADRQRFLPTDAAAIRQRTSRLMHDGVRTCDLEGRCKQTFDYTLAELAPGLIEHLELMFAARKDDKAELNPEWTGTVFG